tara:strand:+ start:9 stop:221 length:213 start_codon:yes stop_codon:yes gene_type:complete
MEELIEQTANITTALKTNLEEITSLGKERRKLWHDIWASGVSQQKIADRCGITRQVVFLEIKRYKKELNA